MHKWLKQMYWKIVPYRIRQNIRNNIVEIRYGRQIRDEVKKYIKSTEGEIKKEFKKINNRIQNNPIVVYNYDFCDNYNIREYIKLMTYDTEKKMYYGNWADKRIYISRLYNTIQMAAECLKNIYMEQDLNSPHRYETESYFAVQGEILIDIGAAEGFFALNHVDNYAHIYIFENDPLWIEALKHTYKAYGEKVEIIEKYVSDKINDKEITIDEFLKKFEALDQVTIKIDVEGAEEKVLKGCKETFERAQEILLFVAAYHKPNDVEMITKYINGFRYELSKGYMINLWENPIQSPFFRKGMIRAKKGRGNVKENIR